VYNTSKYVGSAALDFQPRHAPWRVRLSGNWIGPYSPFDEPGVVLPGYGLAHVGVSWTFDRFEVDGTVRNVFDRAYPELVAGEVVSPGRPRTLALTVRARM
jgi:outer membrane receptor protein involved in Fe transport